MFKIFIANIPLNTSIQELIQLFGEVPTVQDVGFLDANDIPREHLEQMEESRGRSQLESAYLTARPTKFGFVEIPSKAEARALIEAFDGIELPGSPGHTLLLSGPHGTDEP